MVDFLYIHIPFCVRKCVYCDFFSVSYNEPLARRYSDALCRELVLRRNSAGILKTVYIGGGTPSLLPADCFRQIFECIRSHFTLSRDPEITIEANPGTLTAPLIETLLSLGTNRLSLGVQSFRDDELRTLGRIHDTKTASGMIRLIKDVGLANFSLDLMYGIPGQTAESWRETLITATDFSPAHLSAYELTPEKGTALNRFIEAGRAKMPDEDSVARMYETAADFLTSRGFDHYEISNYAGAGRRSLHNLNYWDRGEYIGAGAGAHSFIDNKRWMNTKDIEAYIAVLNSDQLPCEKPLEITPSEAAREFLFLGLRKKEGISLEKSAQLGIHIESDCRDLIDDSYIEIVDGKARLSGKSLVISNAVIVDIFARTGL